MMIQKLRLKRGWSEQQEADAFTYVRKLRGFYFHVIRYAIVSLGLLVFYLVTQPRHLWVFWVIGGWGIGLALHAYRVFRFHSLLGPDWERRQVEKRLGRSL